TQAVIVGQYFEHAEIGHVVPDKDGAAGGKGWIPHQFAHGSGFCDARLLDLEHELAWEELNKRRVQRLANLACRLAHNSLLSRGQPIMQRKRITLVLENYAGPYLRNGSELPFEIGVESRQPGWPGFCAGRGPHFGTMSANCRQLQGSKNQIELGDRSPADESERTARPLP